MKKLFVIAFALVLGAFIIGASQSPANAAAATASVAATQVDVAKDGAITKVWGHRWGYYGGWGYHRWGYRPWGWGWGGPFYGYYGPACRWRCGPYRCWRVCW